MKHDIMLIDSKEEYTITVTIKKGVIFKQLDEHTIQCGDVVITSTAELEVFSSRDDGE